MPGEERTPSDSRCSQPGGAPYRWIDAVDSEHPSVVYYDSHFAAMHPPTRAVQQGEIEELFEAAANGQLETGDDEYAPLSPIVTDPDIWELRYRGLAHYRFYHGEPPKYPAVLVQLHRHVKNDAATQQAEIDHAQTRYRYVD